MAFFIKFGDDLETRADNQFKFVQKEYQRLFDTEIMQEEALFVMIFVLYEAKSGFVFPVEQASMAIRTRWPQSVTLRIIPLPIGNPITENVLSSDFPFQKHIYLKNKIQTYSIHESLQISSTNVSDADRCKKLNLADVDLFRDTIRKTLFGYFVGFFERWFNALLVRNMDIKGAKKKSFWSIFGGETNKSVSNPNEITPPEKHQFIVGELFLMSGGFENAANEFKSLAQAFVVW